LPFSSGLRPSSSCLISTRSVRKTMRPGAYLTFQTGHIPDTFSRVASIRTLWTSAPGRGRKIVAHGVSRGYAKRFTPSPRRGRQSPSRLTPSHRLHSSSRSPLPPLRSPLGTPIPARSRRVPIDDFAFASPRQARFFGFPVCFRCLLLCFLSLSSLCSLRPPAEAGLCGKSPVRYSSPAPRPVRTLIALY
jgi:hypothetical protein